MKKIFAIALALVMVLSMASAFASYCTAGFDWTCATTDNYCGQAVVEVVPYVKTNAACNGSAFVQSDCAAAINGENVYYALKLTVDKDVDKDWFNAASITLTIKGMTKDGETVLKAANKVFKLNEDKSKDGWVYYYVLAGKNAGWVEATEDEDFVIDDVMNKSVVKEFAKAKVCLTLASESKGLAGIVGDYYVEYFPKGDVYTYVPTEGMLIDELGMDTYKLATGKAVAEPVEADFEKLDDTKKGLNAVEQEAYDKAYAKFAAYDAAVKAYNKAVKALTVVETEDVLVVRDEKDGKILVVYTIKDGKIYDINFSDYCGEASYATIKAFFGLEIGTCVDADLIAANFGWDDEVKSCYSWKTENATAIVDTECVVAIPKTGDASVLAWLF